MTSYTDPTPKITKLEFTASDGTPFYVRMFKNDGKVAFVADDIAKVFETLDFDSFGTNALDDTGKPLVGCYWCDVMNAYECQTDSPHFGQNVYEFIHPVMDKVIKATINETKQMSHASPIIVKLMNFDFGKCPVRFFKDETNSFLFVADDIRAIFAKGCDDVDSYSCPEYISEQGEPLEYFYWNDVIEIMHNALNDKLAF